MSYREHLSNSGEYRVPLILLVAALFVCFRAAASEAEPDEVLRVGVREVRPFIFLDEKQPSTAYSIDLSKAIADELSC